MKLPAGQTPSTQSPELTARQAAAMAKARPSANAEAGSRIDPALTARQQLTQLQMTNRETALARVAEILQQKGGGHELILELKGRALAVNTGNRAPDLSVGDLVKVMRANNELQLIGKLAPSQESTVARALAQRLPWQQNLQTGLAQLVNTISTGVKPTAQPGQLPGSNPVQPLPAGAQQALETLIARMPKADNMAPGAGKADGAANQVKQWLSESGVFAESRLLQTSQSSPATTDLKLALARVVANLLASQQQGPEHFNRLTPTPSQEFMQAPLQFPQTTPAAPQTSSEPANVGQMLRMLAGMLNRITVNQLHSQTLTARAGAEPGTPVSTQLIELPWLTPQQEPKIAQLRLEQYEHHKEEAGKPERTSISEWRLTLSIDLDEAGPLHFDVSFRHPSVSAQVWVEKQSTLKQVHQELPLLRQSLSDLGLEVADLDCRRGAPQQAQTRLEHRLVDTKA
jgi:hypothetical protein